MDVQEPSASSWDSWLIMKLIGKSGSPKLSLTSAPPLQSQIAAVLQAEYKPGRAVNLHGDLYLSFEYVLRETGKFCLILEKDVMAFVVLLTEDLLRLYTGDTRIVQQHGAGGDASLLSDDHPKYRRFSTRPTTSQFLHPIFKDT